LTGGQIVFYGELKKALSDADKLSGKVTVSAPAGLPGSTGTAAHSASRARVWSGVGKCRFRSYDKKQSACRLAMNVRRNNIFVGVWAWLV
jgi:hypothetical protein